MRASADIVVIGLGAMGASAIYQLSKHKLSVIGLEQYNVGHVLGSTHGESRIIRQACFEDPCYAPFSLRSYELLDGLDREVGLPHYVRCGGLMIGRPDSAPVAGSLEAARIHGLPFQVLAHEELRRRFPSLNVPVDQVAFFEKNAGAAFPEMIIKSWTAIAAANGAQIYENCRVTAIEPRGSSGVTIRGKGFVIDAGQGIVAVGPWLGPTFAALRGYLSVERIVQHWFKPVMPTTFFPSAFPVFYWDVGPYQLYGFPSLDTRHEYVKVGLDNDRQMCHPDEVPREVSANELLRLDSALGECIPSLQGTHARSEPCLWTVSLDRKPIIDRHPAHNQMIVVGGCSGRGFKFSPVIGEILAQLALDTPTQYDLSPFSVHRVPEVRAPAGRSGS
jgi:sarcosine oxidase